MREMYMTEKRGRTRSMPLETQNPGKYKRSKDRASLGVAGEIDKPGPVSPPCSHGLGHRADPVYGCPIQTSPLRGLRSRMTSPKCFKRNIIGEDF